jgi:hypothetical protein
VWLVTVVQRLTVTHIGSAKVTDVFTIYEYQKALDKMNSRAALKIAVKPC